VFVIKNVNVRRIILKRLELGKVWIVLVCGGGQMCVGPRLCAHRL